MKIYQHQNENTIDPLAYKQGEQYAQAIADDEASAEFDDVFTAAMESPCARSFYAGLNGAMTLERRVA